MCGIAGELRRDGRPDVAALRRMQDAMAARGPDGDGLWSERGAGLACGFNGIVYNHRELRRAHRGSGRGLLRRDYVDRLLADPNGERTTLDGSKLRQVALLELWLQAHTG